MSNDIKAIIDAWVEKYVKRIVAFREGTEVPYTTLNELFNLLIAQGDSTTEAVGHIRDYIAEYSTEHTSTHADITAALQNLQQLISDNTSVIGQVLNVANTAKTTADEAKAIANTAADTVESATTVAQAAYTTAGEAMEKATAVEGQIANVQADADAAALRAEQAFQSASSGKAEIVAAITGKDGDVVIPQDPTFTQLATAISEITVEVGGGGIDTSDATATAADILIPKTAYGPTGKVTGTMPDRGTVNHTLTQDGEEYTIPAGKHSGTGKVVVDVSGLSGAVIKAGEIVGGTTGTFTSDANATTNQILEGYTAYVNGVKVLGAIPVKTSGGGTYATLDDYTVYDGELYVRPSNGYYNGGVFARQLIPNLTAANLKHNVQIGGSNKITGTFTSDATATANDILLNKTSYSAGAKVTGNIPIKDATANYNAEDIYATGGMVIAKMPRGYYNPAGTSANAGTIGGWLILNDPDFLATNILNTANIFNMQGTAVPGIKIASGTVTLGTSQTEFDTVNVSTTVKMVTVSGLTFKPGIIFIKKAGTVGYEYTTMYVKATATHPGYCTTAVTSSENAVRVYNDAESAYTPRCGYVNDTGFSLPFNGFSSGTVTWVALEVTGVTL